MATQGIISPVTSFQTPAVHRTPSIDDRRHDRGICFVEEAKKTVESPYVQTRRGI